MIIKLPNGLLDGGDLFNMAEIDELRGKQQNYLANREYVVGNIGHIPKILEDLVLSLSTKEGIVWKGLMKDALPKLPSGDIETLLIKIREKTYGDRFYFEAQCPHCNHLNKDQRLDLDKLELDCLTVEEMVNVEARTFKLPRSGMTAELKPIQLKDLFDIIKITTETTDKLITSTVALSLARLDANTKVTTKEIENLPAMDIEFLRKQVEGLKLEGSIDTDIELTCSHCKGEIKTKLNVYGVDFFDPSKGSPTSTT